MTIDTHVVFAMTNIRYNWADKLVQTSANGLTRGLCVVGPVSKGVHVRKFTIDATGERCVGAVGRPVPFWPSAELDGWHWWSNLRFNGMRGRMYYTREAADSPSWLMDAVVVDLE